MRRPSAILLSRTATHALLRHSLIQCLMITLPFDGKNQIRSRRGVHAPQVELHRWSCSSQATNAQLAAAALRFLFLLRLPGFFYMKYCYHVPKVSCRPPATAQPPLQPTLPLRRRSGLLPWPLLCRTPDRPTALRRWTTYLLRPNFCLGNSSILIRPRQYSSHMPSSNINDERDHMYTKHIPI